MKWIEFWAGNNIFGFVYMYVLCEARKADHYMKISNKIMWAFSCFCSWETEAYSLAQSIYNPIASGRMNLKLVSHYKHLSNLDWRTIIISGKTNIIVTQLVK